MTKKKRIYTIKDTMQDDALDKLIDSVCWSTGMSDGSSWSNIFWNFESLLKYAGFDLADQQLVQHQRGRLRNHLNDVADQMALYAYKDATPDREAEKEIKHNLRNDRRVLNAQDDLPKLADVKHFWQIDGRRNRKQMLENIPEFNSEFKSADDARNVIENYIGQHRNEVVEENRLSEYVYTYQFNDKSWLVAVLYPIADHRFIGELQ